jgi:hypothetical protein
VPECGRVSPIDNNFWAASLCRQASPAAREKPVASPAAVWQGYTVSVSAEEIQSSLHNK